jgi:helicase MOV-10
MEKLSAFNAVLDEAERDKNGINIEGAFDFDIITPTLGGMGTSVTPVIKMAIPHSRVTLVEINLMSAKGGRPVSSFVFSTILSDPKNMFLN